MTTPPNAIVLLTGSELTRGETRDLNGSFLATELTSLGVTVDEIRLVPDDDRLLRAAMAESIGRADCVVTSGGLGPTADDLTIRALARVLGRGAVEDPAAREAMRIRALARVVRETDIPDNFYKQAEVVEGALVLSNPVGLAPGSLVPTDRGFVCALPGVPRELVAMFRERVAPEILSRLSPSPPRVLRAKILFQPESWAEARIQALGLDLGGIDYGISAKPGELLVKFVAWDPCRHRALDAVLERLEDAFGEDLVRLPDGLRDDSGNALDTSFSRAVHDQLLASGLSLGTAESCTGGLIAAALTDHAGSSEYFRGAIVAYHNDVKRERLGVDAALLDLHGAVSEPVCRAMAAGARSTLGTDLALATTGVAGPGGGSPEKPVGTVWIGLAGPGPDEVLAERRVFRGDRSLVREQTVLRALDLVRRRLASRRSP